MNGPRDVELVGGPYAGCHRLSHCRRLMTHGHAYELVGDDIDPVTNPSPTYLYVGEATYPAIGNPT